MGRNFESPVMSDKTLLISVEDLISIAMGPSNKNKVNYKVIQTVLHILASQMRMLQQRVEITISEQPPLPETPREKSSKSPRKVETSTTESSSGKSPAQTAKERKEEATRRLEEKAERAAIKEKERTAKAAQKEQDKASRTTSRGREKEATVVEKEGQSEEGPASRKKDKDVRSADKEREKEDRAASKVREKTEKVKKAATKDEKAAAKDKEKPEKAASKDEKANIKEKDKAALEKEQEREGKVAAKSDMQDQRGKEKPMKDKAARAETDQEQAAAGEKKRSQKDKEHDKTLLQLLGSSGKSKRESATSIVIKEGQRDKEKVLVVEKGPTTRSDARGRASIEVVTQSQFDILEGMVSELAKKAAPLPMPALPDNQKLRSDLAKGTASLTDTMEAMQVSARVQAAEKAISRMGDLLTQLAAAGALPEDIADKLDDVRQDLELFEVADEPGTAGGETDEKIKTRKLVAIDPLVTKSLIPRPSVPTTASVISRASAMPSVASHFSTASGASGPKVTHSEMDDVLRSLREELKQNMQRITAKTASAADTAALLAKSVAEKMDIAMQLDSRISKLHSLATDYAEQLSGLDAGLGTQMQGFQEQIGQMKSDLKQGLTQLEMVNTNAETAAVMELTERYEGLVSELDHTLQSHSGLTNQQRHLGDELRTLMENVEMLREEKADRDEVLDGLRDKADNSRLAGLLTEQAFAVARRELEGRLEVCHDKFNKQDFAWMNAVKELTEITDGKAELVQLMGLRDQVQQLLQELNDRCTVLAQALGDPKAALTTRQVSLGALCGACMVPVLIEPVDTGAGRPPSLPALRRGPPAADQPCLADWRVPAPPDDRGHVCHRWVGGSHTLVSEAVTRRRAGPAEGAPVPTNKYSGYGDDGRLYMMEEDLLPCVECNTMAGGLDDKNDVPPPSEDGAGDRVTMMEMPPPETDRKVTMTTAERRLTTV